ncbi:MAG: FtsP/CotA-like multicopper oxidase with cupredoxin domain [Bradymonadia bacterium]|jgi:FtsP/CotA-like multicopper oxidase with cupredoxin domain
MAISTVLLNRALACSALAFSITACTSGDAADVPTQDVGVDVAADALQDVAVEEAAPPRVMGVPTLVDLNDDPHVVEVELRAENSRIDIGLAEPLQMMTYNRSFPGPLLEANVGDTVIVHFFNGLDEPTTVHWHGLRIPDAMDGNPRIQEPVDVGESFTYEFVVPDAGTFWYHPHVRANEQVERGLYGPIIVRDPSVERVAIERVVIADDLLLSGDTFAPFMASGMEGLHGRTGNVLVGNGTVEILPDGGELGAVQGTVELWHIINTSNARTFSLSVDGGMPWRVVAVDGGYVEPYTPDRLTVAVGQRYTVEVTHTDNEWTDVVAHVLSLDESDNLIEVPIEVYMVNVVAAEPGQEQEAAPDYPVPPPIARAIDREVTIEFDGVNGAEGLQWRLNGVANREEPLFTFAEGETVRMTLRNLAGPEHPFHLHGQFFEIVDQGTIETSQPGLKDTVLLPGLSELEIIAYFDNPGRWMAHCHILEHAELGMMSEIVVTPRQ